MPISIASSTSRDLFVDTSGFYALLVKKEKAHRRAVRLLRKLAEDRRRAVTTDYVLDETATLLKARGYAHLATAFFESLFSSSACRVEWMDPNRFGQTRDFFVKHADQGWSFTDCFSFHTMAEFSLHDALTTDKHFRQAGFNPLLL